MKFIPSVNDLSELILQYNPFCAKDKNGKLLAFPTFEAAYEDLLWRIYIAGPIAVDPILFCHNMLGMSVQDAFQFVRYWGSGFKEGTYIFLFDWECDNKETDKALALFVRGMHGLSETKFDEAMFNEALCKVKIRIRKDLKTKNNEKKNGSFDT